MERRINLDNQIQGLNGKIPVERIKELEILVDQLTTN